MKSTSRIHTAGTGSVSPKRGWKLKFPGAPFDCESLFIWKDYGYVVSKVFDNARAQDFPLSSQGDERAADARTRRDDENRIASHGRGHFRRRNVCLASWSKAGAYVYRIDGDVARVSNVEPTPHEAKGPAHRRLLLRARWAAGDERAAE